MRRYTKWGLVRLKSEYLSEKFKKVVESSGIEIPSELIMLRGVKLPSIVKGEEFYSWVRKTLDFSDTPIIRDSIKYLNMALAYLDYLDREYPLDIPKRQCLREQLRTGVNWLEQELIPCNP